MAERFSLYRNARSTDMQDISLFALSSPFTSTTSAPGVTTLLMIDYSLLASGVPTLTTLAFLPPALLLLLDP